MAKVNVEIEDFNALTLVRGLEMFLALNGVEDEVDLGNVSEEIADKIGDNYESYFSEEEGESASEAVKENFIALHKALLEAIESAVKAEAQKEEGLSDE